MGVMCCVSWFAERDIDVWLAEELRLNDVFSRWVLERVGAPATVNTPASECRISVVQGRETDVEAVFERSDGGRFALLVEDKIKAAFQPNQMEDYFRRGEIGKNEGRWREFAVLVFAPAYRQCTAGNCAGATTMSFEQAVDFLRSRQSENLRIVYRTEFLEKASLPKAIVASDTADAESKWWAEVSKRVAAEFGDFLAPQSPTIDSYVSPRWSGQPPYLRLDIKGRNGEVALALKGFSESDARGLMALPASEGLAVVKKPMWKDPAICVLGGFQKYEVLQDISEAWPGIHAAYSGAFRLYDFWRSHRETFDRLASNREGAALGQ
jgi:hypothetical protein